MAKFHKPVLLEEVIRYLDIKKGKKYIDATIGGGGHAEAILKLGGILLGIDCDPEAIEAARRHLSSACPVPTPRRDHSDSWQLAQGNFKDLEEIAPRYGFDQVAGILFDLGVSSHQLEVPRRGFSFNVGGPLDMRMDPSLSVTAADLVNGLNKGELDGLFKKIGQEYYSGRLAEAICRARQLRPIRTTNQLAEIIKQALPRKKKKSRLHPATRCFLALRIVVNDELNNLRKALPQALGLLSLAGRLVVISFHSGEDRIVKNFLKESEDRGEIEIITKKPIRPTKSEIEKNPSSRSAKLRTGKKCQRKKKPKD